ncbi:MAG: hypothetical protein IJH17_07120 [Clostridia bacterium]|nr:hypothetical protein [Clostridia bacterium]
MKKIISILLTFSMLIGATPVFAENEDDFEHIEVTVASPWENAEAEAEPSANSSNEV